MKKVLSLSLIWIAALVLYSLNVHYTLIDGDWMLNNEGWWVTLAVMFLVICYFLILIAAIVLNDRCVKYFKK